MLLPFRDAVAEAGVGDGHHAGRDAELEEAIEVLELALVEELGWLPVLDLARELRREVRDIEQSRRRRAVLAGEQRRPRGLHIVADWSDEADAGDDDATLHTQLLARAARDVTSRAT